MHIIEYYTPVILNELDLHMTKWMMFRNIMLADRSQIEEYTF